MADFSQQTRSVGCTWVPKEFSKTLANFSQICQINYIGNAIICSLTKKKKKIKKHVRTLQNVDVKTPCFALKVPVRLYKESAC